MRDQPALKYDPTAGKLLWAGVSVRPRDWRNCQAWRFDPWTGLERHPVNVEDDPFGLEIWHEDEWGPREEPIERADAMRATAEVIAALETAKPADTIDTTLTERGARYGKFIGHAEVTQNLKRTIAIALADREKTLAKDQQEALDMIAHKIGRIVNGDPDYADSWIDIAGYAKLVADRLQGVER
jgi:hypothetical protein